MEITAVERSNVIVKSELYFLIAKFLLNTPFKEVAQTLIQQLEEAEELPERLDWTGESHRQGFVELASKYRHIGPNHLLQICSRLPQLLEQDLSLLPTVLGVVSLTGAGRQSLLRTKEQVARPRTMMEYCTRMHNAPLFDVLNRNNNHNIVNVIYGRQSSGPLVRRQAVPTSFYGKTSLLRQTLGHLSAVYCVLFDRTGKYIVTGADDLLVKLWSAIDGRLLTTFRGASAEITDIAINLENTMLAAGSLDRVLRVWDLQTASVIAVLCAHNGMITSVNFCPNPKSDLKYLVTTSTDGSVAFWQYSQPRSQKPIFQPKPTQYHEKLRPGQAQMICASFSPGGMFLAAGSADHHVRVYIMAEEGPKRILEIESHTDTVDSIQWAHSGLKFVSGSKDGTALLWRYETQQWKFEKLNMSDRLSTCPPSDGIVDPKKGFKVTMVSWDRSDNWIVTAVNDHSIKVWNSKTAKLHNVLRGHTDELYVLESHPKDHHVLLSAGHDGQIFLWDIYKGEKLASFVNTIEGQGHGGIFDAKWSPDGTIIAATDSHGHILMFGFGAGHPRLKSMPKELFFHTDYRPLIRDGNYYVLDEQTQLVPHLMPPPFLVDVDGNPYPPIVQRLVPGRENCPSEQLIPDSVVGDGFEAEGARSEIDLLIEALANRQNHNGQEQQNENRVNSPRRSSVSSVGRLAPPLQQSPASRPNVNAPNVKYSRRVYVKPLKHANLYTMKQIVYNAGVQEMDWYRREIKKRPLMISTGNPSSSFMNGPPKKTARGGRKRRQPGESQHSEAGPSGSNTTNLNNRTTTPRAPTGRPRRHLDDDDEAATSSSETSNSSDSTAVEEDLELSGSSSSDSDSSEYSDWIDVEDQQKLQPPKRSKRKPVERRTFSPADSDSNIGRKTGPHGIKKIPLLPNGEIPDEYKPPEWLSEVIPKKAPYYPQMGDEVVYLRQGHERYFEAVSNKKVYELSGKYEPWQQLELRDHEFCKVIGIKYEIRPPRLCCLKLALMTDDGNMTDKHFTIKYHDIPDVLDFIVLKQTFDTAISRNWGPGDRFRCMIDDKWWIGEIESHQALNDDFPDSLFMCFKVRWDNSEIEFMSPWDMEPVDSERLPTSIGGSVPVLPEEIRATLYRPKKEEWPRGDREGSCRRIVTGFEQVMGLAIADPFLTPVDLNAYPTYAFIVEYPIDLSTIKARFENHFYRRITSAQFDVRYLATNAEKFNEKHSNIVKFARIITDLCLKILRDHNDVDVAAAYHQLQDTYVSSASEDETRPGPSTSRAGPSTSRTNGSRRSRRLVPSSSDWRMQCRELLQMIWNHNDSSPFREPVDCVECPDYLQIIDTPMDLQTLKEELLSGNYETPMEFAKDMRLIFQNSRSYNTNKQSRIYAMTLRMSELFEENVKPLLSHYKYAKKRGENRDGSAKKKTARSTRTNVAGPSTSQDHNTGDSDDDDDHGPSNGRVNGRSRRTHAQSNGVSSSSNIREPPQTNKRSRQQRTKSSADESNSSISSSESSDNSDESSEIPLADLGKTHNKTLKKNHKKRVKKKNRAAVSSSSPKKNIRNSKRRKVQSEDENVPEPSENESEESKSERTSPEMTTSRRSGRNQLKRRIQSSSEDNSGRRGNDEKRKRVCKKPKRYESDQSFHIDGTNKKTADSDSDKPRATRESAKKKFIEWALTSEDDDGNDDDFNQHPQTSSQAQKSAARRSARKNKLRSESDQSEDKKQKAAPSRRSTRTLRPSQSQSQEDSDDSEDRPSTSTNVRNSGRVNGEQHVQTSTSSRTTRSSQNQHSSRGNHDHNYGEPAGPSSSANNVPPRETRSTILSRHQRNADELDRSGLEDSSLASTTQNPRLLRLRSANLRAAPTPTSNFEALNGIRRTTRTRVMHNYFEPDNDNAEEETLRSQSSHQNQSRPRTTRNELPSKNPSDDSDSYSEEDKTPLKLVASSNSKKSHEHNTRNGTAVARVKRNLYSDDEQAGPSNGRSSTRNSRRRHYIEASDEEELPRSSRRNIKPKQIPSQSSDQEESSDEEPSVSSRGRVRKISKRYNI